MTPASQHLGRKQHDPPQKRPAPPADRRRAARADQARPFEHRPRRRGHPCQSPPRGRRRGQLPGGCPRGRAALRRCGRPPGRPLQRGRAGRGPAPPRRRTPGDVRPAGPGAHLAGSPARADAGSGRDGRLVPLGLAKGAAGGPRRAAGRLHVHTLAGPPRGQLHLPAHPLVVPDRRGGPQAQGRGRDRHRPGCPVEKKLIEDAYTLGASLGLSVWCCDQAGPFQTVPHPGQGWRPEGRPGRQPHEYLRDGTAKVLTLFHPADGKVHLKGVTACTNEVLHGWLKQELTAILGTLPAAAALPDAGALRASWERWQQGLTVRPTLAQRLPPLRMLLVLDNLAGHKTPEFVLWLFAHGIMPLYTPLSGSWLNMAESIQRILKRRALGGQTPTTVGQIIGWFEAVARHWNEAPTPFEWGGKRRRRRERQRERRHPVGGSAAQTRRPIPIKRDRCYGYERVK